MPTELQPQQACTFDPWEVGCWAVEMKNMYPGRNRIPALMLVNCVVTHKYHIVFNFSVPTCNTAVVLQCPENYMEWPPSIYSHSRLPCKWTQSKLQHHPPCVPHPWSLWVWGQIEMDHFLVPRLENLESFGRQQSFSILLRAVNPPALKLKALCLQFLSCFVF